MKIEFHKFLRIAKIFVKTAIYTKFVKTFEINI